MLQGGSRGRGNPAPRRPGGIRGMLNGRGAGRGNAPGGGASRPGARPGPSTQKGKPKSATEKSKPPAQAQKSPKGKPVIKAGQNPNKGKPPQKGKNAAKPKAGGKKKKGKPPIQQDTTPVAPAPPNARQTKAGWRGTPAGDYLVIMFLWTIEIFQVCVEATKFKTFDLLILERSYNPQQAFPWNVIHLVFTCLFIIVLGFAGHPITFKFWIVAVTLIFYALVTVLGYMLLVVTSHSSNAPNSQRFLIHSGVEGTSWLWYIINPLRFFLIFHQSWPIKVALTRLIVVINVGLIGLSSYLSTVLIRQKDPQVSTLQLIWLVLAVVMFMWLSIIFFSSFFVNETPIKFEVIRDLYSHTTAYSSFEHRQAYRNVFLLLMVPSVIFRMVGHLVTLSLTPFEDSATYKYRFDLLIALVTIVLTHVVLRYLKRSREEMKDLFAIGAAHVLNLLCLVLLIVCAGQIQNAQYEAYATRQTNREALDWGVLYLVYKEDWRSGLTITVEGATQEFQHSYWARFLAKVAEKKSFKIVGKWNDGKGEKTVFSGSVEIIPKRDTVYHVKYDDSRLVKLRGVEYIKIEKSKRRAIVYNTIPKCKSPKVGLDVGAGKCLEVSVLFKEWAKSSDSKPVKNQEHPVPDVGSKPLILRLNAKKSYLALKIRGDKEIEIGLDHLKSGNLLTVFGSFSKGFCHHYDLLMLPHSEINEQIDEDSTTDLSSPPFLLVLASILGGGAIGGAQSTYIHFIWIRAPFKFRTILFALCWTWFYAVDYCWQMIVQEVNKKIVMITQGLAIFFTILHVLFMMQYRARLPSLKDEEKIAIQF